MTVLDVAKNVARECGFAVPTSLIGNTDETAVQLLALANRAGKVLAKKPWQALQFEHTFNTADGTASYALPATYGWFINDTAWDRTNYWDVRGSLSPQAWQEYKSGIAATSSVRSTFRVIGNLFHIDPTPAAINAMVIECVSKQWAVAVDGVTFAETFVVDTDTTRFPEFLLELELTWRFLARKGLAYLEEKSEAEQQIELAIARDTPSFPVNQAGDRQVWPPVPHWSGTGLGP